MKAFRRLYGANPLHLLAMIASFALAGYAAQSLIQSRPIAVGVWFVGAAIGHDVILLPLYAIADQGARLVLPHRRRRAAGTVSTPEPANGGWQNYVRVPAAISACLLLVYLPSIARLSDAFTPTTGLSSQGYFVRWLGITGVLFLLSALTFAVALRRARSRTRARPVSS